MSATIKDRQISVRIAGETDAWLEARTGGGKNKAGFIRLLIDREGEAPRSRRISANDAPSVRRFYASSALLSARSFGRSGRADRTLLALGVSRRELARTIAGPRE